MTIDTKAYALTTTSGQRTTELACTTEPKEIRLLEDRIVALQTRHKEATQKLKHRVRWLQFTHKKTNEKRARLAQRLLNELEDVEKELAQAKEENAQHQEQNEQRGKVAQLKTRSLEHSTVWLLSELEAAEVELARAKEENAQHQGENAQLHQRQESDRREISTLREALGNAAILQISTQRSLKAIIREKSRVEENAKTRIADLEAECDMFADETGNREGEVQRLTEKNSEQCGAIQNLEDRLTRCLKQVNLTRLSNVGKEAVKDDRACEICIDAEKTHAIIPCGHCFCNICIEQFDICPTCRVEKTATLRVYF